MPPSVEVFRSREPSFGAVTLIFLFLSGGLGFAAAHMAGMGRWVLAALALMFVLMWVYVLIWQPFRFIEVAVSRQMVTVVSGNRWKIKRRPLPFALIGGVEVQEKNAAEPRAAPFFQDRKLYTPLLRLKSGEAIALAGGVSNRQEAESVAQRMRGLLQLL